MTGANPHIPDPDELLRRVVGHDDEKAFEELFHIMYAPLAGYAGRFVDDGSVCQDMVQEVFVSLWERRRDLSHVRSARGYLAVAVRNRCLNLLEKEKHDRRYRQFARQSSFAEDGNDICLSSELDEMLSTALDRLPEAYRNVFEMSCLEKTRMRDVADTLGISLRTAKRYKAVVVDSLKKLLVRNM
ncbi:MAG: sigma-70 family RNA polymerase sigma factor [Alistipes sp.]|nr:sigma-70 family RNA polymerase sigma factor [Alistipes sp.]